MTLEELAVIAEGIGYKVKAIIAGHWLMCENPEGIVFEFNPIEDNDHAMKVMVKCGISVSPDNSGDGWYATLFDTDISIHELSTDDEEDIVIVRRLICKAAYEDFKEKDDA